MNPYKHTTEEKSSLDPQTVFTIKHSDIPKGVTQCVKHTWVKHSENEIRCPICGTVNIVRDINEYI